MNETAMVVTIQKILGILRSIVNMFYPRTVGASLQSSQ